MKGRYGSVNKKIIKTKKALRNALNKLRASQRVQDITVARLCREAGINRTTFYKYYSLPNDILKECIDEIYLQAMEGVSLVKNSPSVGIYSLILKLCYMYYENSDIMRYYLESNGNDLLAVQRLFLKEAKNNLPENNTVFISGGVVAIIAQWCRSDFNSSPENIAQILTDFILKLII